MDSSFVFKGVMNLIDYRFSLELTKGGIQKTLHAKSGEGNGRRALITLTESGKVFDLDGCTARVFFEDNTHSDYLAVVGGCFEFVLPAALLESAGEKKCELQLEKNGGVVYSPVFTILVEGSIGGKAYDSVELGEPIRYQEVIQSLPEGSSISNADEIAVYSAAVNKTRRVSVSAFAKSTDIDAVDKRLDEVDNNLAQVEETILGINTKADQNETGIYALGDRVSVIEGYNIPQRFYEVNNRIDNINVSGGGSVEMLPPNVVAAQTVVSLLETINDTFISFETPDIASMGDSRFAIILGSTSTPMEYGGYKVFYAPPIDGELTYINPTSSETETIKVYAGFIYEFFSVYTEDWVLEFVVNPYFGENSLGLLKQRLFTADDKTEIANAVLNALETAEGGLY